MTIFEDVKEYKGKLMLFGLFHIRKDANLYIICSGTPYTFNKQELERNFEQIIQKYCTIKWIEDVKTNS